MTLTEDYFFFKKWFGVNRAVLIWTHGVIDSKRLHHTLYWEHTMGNPISCSLQRVCTEDFKTRKLFYLQELHYVQHMEMNYYSPLAYPKGVKASRQCNQCPQAKQRCTPTQCCRAGGDETLREWDSETAHECRVRSTWDEHLYCEPRD